MQIWYRVNGVLYINFTFDFLRLDKVYFENNFVN